MNRIQPSLSVSSILLLAAAILAPGMVSAEDKKVSKFTSEQIGFFEKEVQPVLENRCYKCHGDGKKVKGSLRLNSRANVLKGGVVGPAVSLENRDKSLVLQMISYKDDEHQMPPKGKLPQAEIDLLTRWVKMGIPWTPGAQAPGGEAGAKETAAITAEDRAWWAYKPVKRPAVPAVKDGQWIKNPIDAFILSRLEKDGLRPAPPASKETLVRRAYYNLIGLPPTPAEVKAFQADNSPGAWEALIDRLLESRHYGEKWARHWLDLVRFAETHGYERDNNKAHAWRYRDYVIKSFNEDKPYDRFVMEQIAGDELENVDADSISATGFYRLGIWNDEPADRLLAKYDVLDGVLSTTTQVVMGMTVGCARCHDHKKDPIPQEDYYRLLAFFQDVTNMNDRSTRKVMDNVESEKLKVELAKKEATENGFYNQIFQLEEDFKLALMKKDGLKTAAGVRVPDLVELSFKFYRDTWKKLPDFDLIKHEAGGKLADGFLSLRPASRKHAVGLVFEGKLRVPADGKYSFKLSSTAGIRLLVGGKKVFEADGAGSHSGDAPVELKAGLRDIRLEYFNAYEEPSLSVLWSGPDFTDRGLTLTKAEESTIIGTSKKDAQRWSYTLKKPEGGWARPGYKTKGWKKGPGGFGTNGTPGAVVRTEWKTRDIWLRKEFSLERLPGTLFLDICHDEDAEVYINGALVKKLSGHRNDYISFSLPQAAVKALGVGLNTIAVHCKQTGGGQYIDVGLRAGKFTGEDITSLIKRRGEELIGAANRKLYDELRAKLQDSKARGVVQTTKSTSYDTMAVAEKGRSPTHILLRGNPHLQGKKVEPGFPAVLTSVAPRITQRPDSQTSGKRRALAEWMVSKDNPTSSRTIANRLWQFHFGRGICPTPSDFGKLGQLPTHPELLDWLAVEMVARDWKLKDFHKLLMTSNAYRMSSKSVAKALEADPANNLFWRFNMRRLSAEEIRDSILKVNGTLSTKYLGASFYPEVPREVLQTSSRPGGVWRKSSPEEQRRRSVYIFIKRSLIPPMLSTHDLADTDSSCASRFTTTVPTQALTMLNSKFLNDQAGVFSAYLQKDFGDDVRGKISAGLHLVFCRKPAKDEVDKCVKLINDFQVEDKLSAEQAFKYFCLLALNLNEFVYLD
jgi:hypothetical protein